MIILGIESTCDETAASLVEDGRHLLSNVISTSVKEQALYGGVVPEIASRRHCEFISATVKKALLDAGKTIDDVDAVAVTFAPELLGTEEYSRIRFGIGGDFPRGHQVDYVLGHWNDEERKAMPERLKYFGDAILSFAAIGPERTMNLFNKK